jgi:hypothetical protein
VNPLPSIKEARTCVGRAFDIQLDRAGSWYYAEAKNRVFLVCDTRMFRFETDALVYYFSKNEVGDVWGHVGQLDQFRPLSDLERVAWGLSAPT